MPKRVAIVGGGPGGAATALMLARSGISATIVESAEFPRFHIGESMTGALADWFRTMGLIDMLTKCDHTVKRGVHVYGPSGANDFWVPVMRREGDEHVQSHSWHVRRSQLDAGLLEAAVAAGATIQRAKAVGVCRSRRGDIAGVRVRDGLTGERELAADVVVDASGAATVLSTLGVASKKVRGGYDRQISIYAHMRGVRRDEGVQSEATLIFVRSRGHWGWMIPIGDEVTSVGMVVPASYYRSVGLSPKEFFEREINDVNPQLARRLVGAEAIEWARTASNYSYQVRRFTGRNFLCIGDAHRFVDPIFSFGLHLAVFEAKYASEHILRFFNEPSVRERDDPFAEFADVCDRAQGRVESMIDCFWANSLAFAFFVHHKYKRDMIDAFAGRLYGEQLSPGMRAIARAALLAS